MDGPLPISVDVYVGAIIAVGVVVVGWSVVGLAIDPASSSLGATLAVLCAGGEPLPAARSGYQRVVLDLRHVLHHLGAAVRPGAGHRDHGGRQHASCRSGVSSKLRRFLFNGSAPALAFWFGAQVFFGLSGAAPLYGAPISADTLVVPLACFAVVYFVLNSGLTAVADRA